MVRADEHRERGRCGSRRLLRAAAGGAVGDDGRPRRRPDRSTTGQHRGGPGLRRGGGRNPAASIGRAAAVLDAVPADGHRRPVPRPWGHGAGSHAARARQARRGAVDPGGRLLRRRVTLRRDDRLGRRRRADRGPRRRPCPDRGRRQLCCVGGADRLGAARSAGSRASSGGWQDRAAGLPEGAWRGLPVRARVSAAPGHLPRHYARPGSGPGLERGAAAGSRARRPRRRGRAWLGRGAVLGRRARGGADLRGGRRPRPTVAAVRRRVLDRRGASLWGRRPDWHGGAAGGDDDDRGPGLRGHHSDPGHGQLRDGAGRTAQPRAERDNRLDAADRPGGRPGHRPLGRLGRPGHRAARDGLRVPAGHALSAGLPCLEAAG